jgi:3-hydroxyisobutyrate dehydrogenase
MLEHAGARLHKASDGADAVIAMTAGNASSRSLARPDGILATWRTLKRFAIECSTLPHSWVLEFARQAQARDLR